MPSSRVAVVYTDCAADLVPPATEELLRLTQAQWAGAKVHPPIPFDPASGALPYPQDSLDVMELMVAFVGPVPSAELAMTLLGALEKLPLVRSLVVLSTTVTQHKNTAEFISPLARACRVADVPLTVVGTQEASLATRAQFMNRLAAKWSEKCSKRQRLHQTFVKSFRTVEADAVYGPLRVPGVHKHEFSSALIVQDTATRPGYLLWSSQWCPTPEIEGRKNANTEWKVTAIGPGAPAGLDKDRVLALLDRMNKEASRPATQELRALYKLRNHESVLWDILSEFHGEAADELFYCCLPNNHTRQLCGFFTRGMRKLDRTVRDVLIRHPEVVYHYGGSDESEPMKVEGNSASAAMRGDSRGERSSPDSDSDSAVRALQAENEQLRITVAEKDAELASLRSQFNQLQLQHNDLIQLSTRPLDTAADYSPLQSGSYWDPLPIRPTRIPAGGVQNTRYADHAAIMLGPEANLMMLQQPMPDLMAQAQPGNEELLVDLEAWQYGNSEELGEELVLQPDW